MTGSGGDALRLYGPGPGSSAPAGGISVVALKTSQEAQPFPIRLRRFKSRLAPPHTAGRLQ